jgi:hypothetical protein
VVKRSLLILILVVAALACPDPAAAQTVWAVGDGAAAGADDEAVAARIQAEAIDRFLYLGDVYDRGTAREFATRYESAFGRFKPITNPTPGNHEWSNRAEGYDAYWGSGVRQPDGGHWYSFDLNDWHFVSLSSMEAHGPGSPQLAWLQADLARYPGTCTIAFTHYPRFSAGPAYNVESLEPLFAALSGHAVALLAGHEHNYQRHLPTRGITQFVVGTGGHSIQSGDGFDPRLAYSRNDAFGALRLRLALGQATFEFVPVSGPALDAGSLECLTHAPAPARHRVIRPQSRVTYPRLRSFRGRVHNGRSLRLRLVRRLRPGGRCEVFDGEAFRRASCRPRLTFPVDGRTSWRWRYPRAPGLPPGGYRLAVIADGLDGTVGDATVRFRVERRGQ